MRSSPPSGSIRTRQKSRACNTKKSGDFDSHTRCGAETASCNHSWPFSFSAAVSFHLPLIRALFYQMKLPLLRISPDGDPSNCLVLLQSSSTESEVFSSPLELRPVRTRVTPLLRTRHRHQASRRRVTSKSTEGVNVHNSTHRPGSAFDRRFTHMAVQHGLGLLSKRWLGIGPGHRAGPRSDGPRLRGRSPRASGDRLRSARYRFQ